MGGITYLPRLCPLSIYIYGTCGVCTYSSSPLLCSQITMPEETPVAMAAEVEVVESSFVAPSAATPRKGLWVSSLDLDQANRGHTPMVYFYRSAGAAAAAPPAAVDVTSRLKESLAKALVAFYPLAGRLSVDSHGRTEIDCNGEGALFVVARSERTLDDFSDLEPSPELRKLFIPSIDLSSSSIISAIQVTLLKCGGISLGTALHHAVVDGLSAFHFMETWSAMSRSSRDAAVEMEMELPCHDRTLLRARSPPFVHPDALSVFCPKITFLEPSAPIACKVLVVSEHQLASLKRLCGDETTFCALSAIVWQCAVAARRLPPDAEARISFYANIRRSIRPPLPDRYCGNAIVPVFAAGAAGDIASGALASVSARIRGVINRLDDQLVRSAIDYNELFEIDHWPPTGTLPKTDLRMVSWLGMPMYDADFGWGKPWRVSRAGLLRGGYVQLVNDGTAADSSIHVLASMEAAHLEDFQRLLYEKLVSSSQP